MVANALSETTRRDKPEVAAFVRELIMRQDPEGYARNCEALAAATDPGPVDPGLPLLLITGSDDKIGPPAVSQALATRTAQPPSRSSTASGTGPPWKPPRPVTDHLLKFL